jgi:hypothetical protein
MASEKVLGALNQIDAMLQRYPHDDGSSLFSPRRQSSPTMNTARSVGSSDLLIGTILPFVEKFFTLGSFFKLDLLKK